MSTVPVSAALDGSPQEVGKALLAVPEDQWFDRKSARISARDLANSMIAIANADGGWIVVGLHDGHVEGTDRNVKRRNEQMQANVDHCVSPVRARSRLIDCVRDESEADHLLVFEIDPSDVVHANVKDEVYLRVGDEDRRLTFSQRQELLFDKGQASYEVRPVPGAGFDQLEWGLLVDYADAIGAPDSGRLLQARGLADRETLTVAGCLLFARYP
jgi:ATP-dependent DNA helicase RecG